MKKLVMVLVGLAIPLISLAQDWDKVEIKTHKINDHISVLYGRGGNIGVLSGADGLMIVDAQYAELSDKISQALAEITDSDLRFILSTHWHGDHVGGNDLLAKGGAVILAQDNVRKRMSTKQYMEWVDRKVPASTAGSLPVITFDEQITFHLNGEEVYVYHGAPAHTDGDAVVWFKTSNVIHMGDIFVTYGFPFIDVSGGGMLEGMIDFQGKVLDMINDQTVVIPGHGPISSKSDLEKFRNQLIDIRNKLMPFVLAGKSQDEVIAENPIVEYDELWSTGWVKSKDFIVLVYKNLKLDN